MDEGKTHPQTDTTPEASRLPAEPAQHHVAGMPPASEKRRAFLVFEGGGAKGIVHVGALASLEDPELNLDVRGAAGTSAGAIVAGFVAAGYTAREICNPKGRTSILAELGVPRATDLFGRRAGVRGWNWLQAARAPFWLLAVLLAMLGAVNLGVASGLPHLSGSWLFMLASQTAVIAALVWGLLVVLRRGICTTHAFTEVYDEALRAKIGRRAGGRVTFRELYEVTGRLLKVVATQVDTGQVAVFGTFETPDLSMAEAVAASICIPGVFEPARIAGREGSLFYDGGLVSNLPVWTFDEERLLDPAALTIAFEIAATPGRVKAAGPLGAWSWLRAAVRAAVFGAAVLDRRGANRLVSVTLPSSVGLLQFDMRWPEISQEFENGRLAAATTVLDRLVNRPRAFDQACEVVRVQAEAAIRAAGPEMRSPGRIRVFLAVPLGGSGRLLQLAFSAPREFRTDEASVLPVRGSLAGAAWADGEVYFDQVPFEPIHALQGPENAKRRALVWQEVQWRVTIPIYTERHPEGGRPAMVLCIDGSGSGDVARTALDEELLPQFASVVRRACDAFDV